MARDDLFLCIDAGTTRFKSALVSIEGSIEAKEEYYYPHLDDLRHEYHTGEFRKALDRTLGPLTAFAGERIRAVGVTGHGPTLIPVGPSGAPLYAGVGYLDDRVKKYIAALAKKTQNLLTSTMYIPIALFFKEEQPEIYGSTHKFLQSFDYLVHLLAGEYTASASSLGIRPWDRGALEAAGLDSGKFPEVSIMGQEVGRTSGPAREKFGIERGIPVYAVGVDFAAALVGAGTMRKGMSCERAGSSGGINLCWDRLVGDRRLLSYEHFIDGLWNVAGITSTSGKAVDWITRLLGITKRDPFRYGEVPKRVLFLPYLKGERTPLWDPYAQGVFYGLRLEHDREDLVRAVYLGTALAIRDCIQIIEENGCAFMEPVVTTGWGAREEDFVRFKADVVGKSFSQLQTQDGELLGVAIVCAVSEGLYGDLASAAGMMVRTKNIFHPDEKRHSYFNELFSLYKEIQQRVIMNKLFDGRSLLS
jgi:xylulokinase